ncbi:thioredoxin domain-containing protein 8 [Ictidomys tridecemlineatus]
MKPPMGTGRREQPRGPSSSSLDEFNTFLKDAGRQLVVVEFSANWCGFCKEKCSVFHDMPLQYQNVRFAIVDVDDSPELADACHIKAVPTFQIFKKIQKVCFHRNQQGQIRL